MSQLESRSQQDARLEALYRYGILDTPVEADFDELTALASQVCEVPLSAITFVDRDRQWFKSLAGAGEGSVDNSLENSICVHAIKSGDLCLVPDTRADERFVNNPLVTSDPGLRFYAGAVLRCPEGHALGTLCVMDHKPRVLADSQLRSLKIMARNIMQMLEIRRQAEAHRQISLRLNEELELRKSILGVVSHDLRAPLSSIHLATHVAEKEHREGADADVMLGEMVDVLRDAVVDMNRLISDLSDFSMAEQGRLTMRFQECDGADVVEGVERRFKLAAADVGITLHRTDESGGESFLKADAQRLAQALGNLVANALKFTPTGGAVFLTTRRNGGELEFVVRDTGGGISAENLPKVFERYWTAGEKNSGRGLGLEITGSIVQAHGGTIGVTSEIGKGTQFIISIPALEV